VLLPLIEPERVGAELLLARSMKAEAAEVVAGKQPRSTCCNPSCRLLPVLFYRHFIGVHFISSSKGSVHSSTPCCLVVMCVLRKAVMIGRQMCVDGG